MTWSVFLWGGWEENAAALLTPGLGCGEGGNGPRLFVYGQPAVSPALFSLGAVELLCVSFPAAPASPSICHLLLSVAFWLCLDGVTAAGLPVSSSPHQGASDEELLCCFLQTLGRSWPTAERVLQNMRLRLLCITEQ